MKASNVKELDLDSMLDVAEITAGVLRVAHGLMDVEGYTKEEAAQELIQFLEDRGLLNEVKK